MEDDCNQFYHLLSLAETRRLMKIMSCLKRHPDIAVNDAKPECVLFGILPKSGGTLKKSIRA